MFDLAKFVVKENYDHHSQILPNNFRNEVNSVYYEELDYFSHSETFIAQDYMDNILGSIRILKWDYKKRLPIQSIFKISPSQVARDMNINTKNIYHIGRFAIKKNAQDSSLFKKLMICALSFICEDKNKDNIAFSECDSKLLRVLKLMGIQPKVIGAPIEYLGSDTIPIYLDYHGVINFYNKNKTIAPSYVAPQLIKNKMHLDHSPMFIVNSIVL